MPRKILVSCDTCGTSFNRWPCKVRKANYCGHACSYGKQGKAKRPFEWLFNRLKRSAYSRGFPVLITFDEFVSFTKISECFYCKASITWSESASTNSVLNSSGYNLDRMDILKGYAVDNLVACCARCNWSRGSNFTHDEWVQLGKVIQTFVR